MCHEQIYIFAPLQMKRSFLPTFMCQQNDRKHFLAKATSWYIFLSLRELFSRPRSVLLLQWPIFTWGLFLLCDSCLDYEVFFLSAEDFFLSFSCLTFSPWTLSLVRFPRTLVFLRGKTAFIHGKCQMNYKLDSEGNIYARDGIDAFRFTLYLNYIRKIEKDKY